MKNKIIYILILASINFIIPVVSLASGGCSDYGTYATEDALTGKCKCMTGFVFSTNTLGNTYCMSGNVFCQEKYGFASRYNSSSESCECSYGYEFSKDSVGRDKCVSINSKCIDKLGYNSEYDSISGTCRCSRGFILDKGTIGGYHCVSLSFKCGYNAEYDPTSSVCKCQSGYMIKDGKCTSGTSWCVLNQGIYSKYNDSIKSCECFSGYVLGSNGRCDKKQNNVYFTLEELDIHERKAIIKSEYDYSYYLITYGYGCSDSSLGRYLGDRIVLNLGTDYSLDVSDKIVLQEDNEVCDIISEKAIGSNTSLQEEKKDNDLSESERTDISSVGDEAAAANTNTNENQRKPITGLLAMVVVGGFIWIVRKFKKRHSKVL